eukprot:COSAG02_NODE_197_length_29578_cov_9.718647_11_plen_141_part_00
MCLCEVEIVRKGGGAGFEPMTCSGGVLRFRARCQYCTEAKSEVICNPSPELFGSLLFTTKFGVDNVGIPIFSDYGITLVLGRLEQSITGSGSGWSVECAAFISEFYVYTPPRGDSAAADCDLTEGSTQSGCLWRNSTLGN